MRHLLTLLIVVVTTATNAAAQSTIFIVRHAERADAGAAQSMMADDPDLSAAGHARAKALAAMLADAGIEAIFTTEYKRTRQTAAPLASARGIKIESIPSKDVAALAAKLKSARENVLVVGHSNTVPLILKELGITAPVTIGEQEYDNLFIVGRGDPPTLLRLRYR